MSFGHAGDGNLHIYVLRDDLPEKGWHMKMDIAFNRMYARAKELGGQVSGEHGEDFTKKGYLKEPLSERTIDLMQGIKQVFEPRGILNSGKRCASRNCQGLSVVVWYQAFLECFEERLIEFIAGQA